jgi:ActR/RegA family two-component response regulator
MSNVENISTAVGGVKMAGMTTGLDKLAKPAQATAINTAKVAENTGRMANASAAP